MRRPSIWWMLFIVIILARPIDAKAQDITLMLDWFVNPNHATIVIAKQMGFFKQQHLNVKILEPADPSDPPKLSAIKKVDYALTYQSSLQMQAAQGWKNMRVATIISSPLDGLIVLKSSHITTLEDLKGKRIGYSVPGVDTSILNTMLQTHGLHLRDVVPVNVKWALTASLMTKKVDAIVGGYRNFELIELGLEGSNARIFYPEENGVPLSDSLILVTHYKNASTPTTRGLVYALQKAVVYIKNHPQEAWEKFKSYRPSVLDSKLNRLSFFATLRRFSSAPAALDYRRYRSFVTFLRDNNMIKNTMPPIETYAVDPFAP